MTKQIDLQQMKDRYVQFKDKINTVIISTKDENGDPFISYSPYVEHDGKFYIYISAISEHYQYIERNNRIHVMLISDENKSPNLFARERVRIQCSAENIGDVGHEEIFTKFEEIHGTPMMGVLRGIDMSLFELTPEEGRYVVGFGQAFDIDLLGEKFEHVVVEKNSR